ncbi:MAG: hypothetical protein KC472_06570 [Dehalococcoidia bacterium]|nr:hypothetical protein [Dehalococcoidia bacterium]
MAEIDVERKVRDLLAEAGFTLTEEQIAIFVEAYPALREGADSLFAVQEARYEEPAVIYPAKV